MKGLLVYGERGGDLFFGNYIAELPISCSCRWWAVKSLWRTSGEELKCPLGMSFLAHSATLSFPPFVGVLMPLGPIQSETLWKKALTIIINYEGTTFIGRLKKGMEKGQQPAIGHLPLSCFNFTKQIM